MKFAIELPSSFVEFQAHAQIEHDMRLAYALWLLKGAKVTIAKAAELAGLNIYEFIKACKDNQVAVIDISRDELLEELEGLIFK
jgi:predicted HTH domain antitoxin